MEHRRLSDSVDLIRTGHVVAGKAPPDVQLYWLGFLTVAGQIMGSGSSLTLVVTLGDERPENLDPLLADLMTGYVRWEFCRSSVVGWQGYLRGPAFCKALIPWGIPSNLYGDDPSVLHDPPDEFVTPFLRGYVDGDRISRGSPTRRRESCFTLRGTPAFLAGIKAIIQKSWNVSGGPGLHGAELRFADPTASRAIYHQLETVASRFGTERSPDRDMKSLGDLRPALRSACGAFTRSTGFDQDKIGTMARSLTHTNTNGAARRKGPGLTHRLRVALVAAVNAGHGPRETSFRAHTLQHKAILRAV